MNKILLCPFNKKCKFKKEEYDKHLIECPVRGDIWIEKIEDIEIKKTLDNIATEKEQIAYVRHTEYKGCVEDNEIIGLPKKKQKNKKKKNKIFKK